MTHHQQHASSSSYASLAGSITPAFYNAPNSTVASSSNNFSTPSIPQINFVIAITTTPASVPHMHAMVNSFGVDGISSSWVIDSGATDHEVNSLIWFVDYKVVSDMHVNLLDKIATPVTHIGTVKLFENLILHDLFTYAKIHLQPDFSQQVDCG